MFCVCLRVLLFLRAPNGPLRCPLPHFAPHIAPRVRRPTVASHPFPSFFFAFHPSFGLLSLSLSLLLLVCWDVAQAIGNSADRDSSIRSYNDGIERWLHSGHYDLFAQVAGGAFQVSFQNPFPPLDVSLARSTREPFRLADTGRSSDSVKIQAYPDHELVHLGEAELDVSGMCRDTTGCNTDPALGRFVIKFNGAQANDYRMPLFTSTRSLAEYEADCCDGCWWDELRGWCYKYNMWVVSAARCVCCREVVRCCQRSWCACVRVACMFICVCVCVCVGGCHRLMAI